MAKKKAKKGIKKSGSSRKKKVVVKKGRKASTNFWTGRYAVAAVLAITLISLSPVLTNDFINLDDPYLITENELVQEHSPFDFGAIVPKQLYSAHYKPLTYFTWMVERSLFGNNPFVFHLNNLLLHLLNTLLVFFILLRMSRFWSWTEKNKHIFALFGALLFGIHPLHVESVAWAVERKDVLFSIFYLTALLSYLKYIQDKNAGKWLWIAVGCYFLSTISKSMGITLIAILPMLDFASGRKFSKDLILEKLPFLGVMLIDLYLYGYLSFGADGAGGVAGSGGSVAGVSLAPDYLKGLPPLLQEIIVLNLRFSLLLLHVFMPVKLAAVYPREQFLEIIGPGSYLFLIAAIAGAALLLWSLRKTSFFLLTFGFFAVALSPILAVEGVGTNFLSDRYTYIPSIGLIIFTVAGILWLMRNQVDRSKMVLGGICLLMAVATFLRASDWKDGETLWRDAVKKFPSNWLAYHSLGDIFRDSDRPFALQQFNTALDLMPNHHRLLYSRGTLHLNMGNNRKAVEDLDKLLAIDPLHVKGRVNRANALRDLKEYDEAIADYTSVIERRRKFIKAYNNRGVAYLRKRQFDKAIADFDKVIQLDPQYVNGYINRASYYLDTQIRQWEEAIKNYDAAIRFDPVNSMAHYWRGYCKSQLNRSQQAMADYNQAITLNANVGYYWLGRSRLHKALGNNGAALSDAQRAQQLGTSVSQTYLSSLQ